jgi:alanine dehydrogenase
VRVLDSSHVRELVSLEDVIDSVTRAYRQLGSGTATDVPRENVRVSGLDGSFKSLPGASETAGAGGFFYTGGFPGDAATMTTLVYDPEDGGLQAVIESDRLSWLRTGATSAVATDHCARSDAEILGLIGAGTYAESQLLGVAAVRDLDQVRVYSPTPDSRQGFAARLSRQVDTTIEAVGSAEAAVGGADIVCTATTAGEPVFDGERLAAGTHVNSIGSHYPEQREVDSQTVERARVIADTLGRARKEEGELLLPIEEGHLGWTDILELGAVVTGDAAGRTSDQEVTLFTSGGIGVEYLLVAREVSERAAETEVGTEIDLSPEADHLE